MGQAYGGNAIRILQTGESFLLTESQPKCHAACLAHPECLYYQWYDALSVDNANKCILLSSQNSQVIDEEFLQYGAKSCDLTPTNPVDFFLIHLEEETALVQTM